MVLFAPCGLKEFGTNALFVDRGRCLFLAGA
jgi:hypothetical protein